MKLANFNSINPNIIWNPRSEKNSSSYIWQQIKKKISSDLKLLIPPTIAVLGIGYIASEIMATNININKNFRDHEEYEESSKALTISEASNNRMKTRVENTRIKLVKSMHPYVFSKELQTIIPESVQLKSYQIDANNVNVEARSYDQKSIDEFIVFLNNHSNIEPNSVTIEELISQTETNQNEQISEDLNRQGETTKRFYEVKVSAKFRISDEVTLKKKITEFGDFYLLKKLSIFTGRQL